MAGKIRGQVVAVDLDVDQVHGQRELVGVQHSVLKKWAKTISLGEQHN